nr:MAG TPA: hypothetical protein [Caudoviricetes sp.]
MCILLLLSFQITEYIFEHRESNALYESQICYP